jgi:nucleoside-diphosphate-sugar epimerase
MILSQKICSEVDLEELLTRPTAADIEAARHLDGDVLVLGAGGKMGPSLVVRIKRSFQEAGLSNRVLAVVRKDRDAVFAQHKDGVDLIETDLLDPASYARLPDAANVIFMAGRKFGSVGDQPLTWATNVLVAGFTADRYQRSRIIAFSTGNIYPFMPVTGAGASELTMPEPRGEYAQSALGRERIFEYFANAYGTPTLIYRLNYAVDLRYGVLVDIGNKVKDGVEIDLTTGYANVIWQGDANSYCLRSFSLCESPAKTLNVTGLKTISVREIAERFGQRFGTRPRFKGEEASTALLSDARLCANLLGPADVDEDLLFEMTADWLSNGGITLGKPTKFESRDGHF